jgi:N-acylneuraminate cytidylyltransferase
MAQDLSPDIEWIEHLLARLADEGGDHDAFAILRPTNPFRTADTIRRAWRLFSSQTGVDSLRAVEKCTEHPGKMWVLRGTERPRMTPLLPFAPSGVPWHSSAYQSLPEVYVQNASLEIAWTRVVREGRTIAGETVVPFVSQGLEGYDINRPHDLKLAEEMIASGEAVLPCISAAPYEAPCAPANRSVGEAA